MRGAAVLSGPVRGGGRYVRGRAGAGGSRTAGVHAAPATATRTTAASETSPPRRLANREWDRSARRELAEQRWTSTGRPRSALRVNAKRNVANDGRERARRRLRGGHRRGGRSVWRSDPM